LKSTTTLDKTKIGEYLGEDIDLNKKVLYNYVDSYNFAQVPYVESMKRLLSGFRLPGEGQKVDRIMEKFGEKYCKDNHNAFGSAECIYLLSYATMMLQTSIHNPQAQKSRMTLDDFLKMTKGLNNGKDLDPSFIEEIYKTVEKEPFTLTEDEDAKLKLEAVQATSLKRKQDLFAKEAQGFVKRGAAMIKQQKGNATNGGQLFVMVNDTEPIRPMFENTWSANLAVFSVLLEESDD
jgi:brefeldin A-inhibited guanine nucleotide-exchange protein